MKFHSRSVRAAKFLLFCILSHTPEITDRAEQREFLERSSAAVREQTDPIVAMCLFPRHAFS